MRPQRSAALLPVCIAALGCIAEAKIPDTPDMQALVDAYEHPDAELDGRALEQQIGALVPALIGAQVVGDFSFVLDSVTATAEGFVVRGFDQDLGVDVRGAAVVRRICPGFDRGEREPDPAIDGVVELTVPIEHAALGPVAFGPADNCRVDEAPEVALPTVLPPWQEPFRAELDGELSIHLGRALALGEDVELTPVIAVDGELAIDGLPVLRDFDVRIPSPMVLETRLIDDAGQSAVVVLDQESVRVRERRGTWVCNLGDATECSSEFP